MEPLEITINPGSTANETDSLTIILKELKLVSTDVQHLKAYMTTSHTSNVNIERGDNVKIDPINWDCIQNIQDLLRATSTYSTDRRFNNVLYIKCNACSSVIYSSEGHAYQTRIKRHDTFPYGLKVQKTNEEKLFSGDGRAWHIWKSKLKKHYEGSDANTDLHWK